MNIKTLSLVFKIIIFINVTSLNILLNKGENERCQF